MENFSLLQSLFPSLFASQGGLESLLGFDRGPTFDFGSLGSLVAPQASGQPQFQFGGSAPQFSLSPINRPPIQLSQPVPQFPTSLAALIAPQAVAPSVVRKPVRREGGDGGPGNSGGGGGGQAAGPGGQGSGDFGGPR